MAKICEYCTGKGTYIVKETFSDGDEILTAHNCNHCHGTGRAPDPEEDGPGNFDIDGSSMLEDDDDDED